MEKVLEIVKEPIKMIVFFTLRFLINIVRYFLFTTLVLLSIIPIFYIATNLHIDFLIVFIFLLYSFINPAFQSMYQTGNISIGLGETMKMVFALTFVFMFISILTKALLKRFFKFELSLSYKSKLLYSFIIISVIYVILLVITRFTNVGSDFYILFTISYFLYLFLYFIYFSLQRLIDKLKKLLFKQKIEVYQPTSNS